MSTLSLSQRVTELVKALRRDVPECLAAGIVDLSTGMVVALETVETHPQDVIELVALVTLATTAAGRWGGLDFFIHRWFIAPQFCRRKADPSLSR